MAITRRLAINLAIAAMLAPMPALAQETFKIGLNAELTGHATSYGAHMKIAAEIARDQINAAGGVNGAKIELVIEDNRSSPEQAVIAVRNLSQKKVAAILGPVQSSQCRTAFPATNREQLVSVSSGSGAPGLTKTNRPWSFRNAAIDQVIIDELVANLRTLYPNAKKVVITQDPKDAYSKFLTTAVAPAALKKNGFEIVNEGALIEVPDTTEDFSVFVTKIKAMEPDVVLLGMLFEKAKGFLLEANRQKLTVPMFAGLGYITETVAQSAGGVTVFAGQPFDPDAQDAMTKTFTAEFKKRVEKELPGQYTTPTYIDGGAYETILMIAQTLKAAGVKPGDAPEKQRVAVRDGLAAMKNFQGLGNTLSVNEEGDAIKPTIQYRTVSGAWTTKK